MFLPQLEQNLLPAGSLVPQNGQKFIVWASVMAGGAGGTGGVGAVVPVGAMGGGATAAAFAAFSAANPRCTASSTAFSTSLSV